MLERKMSSFWKNVYFNKDFDSWVVWSFKCEYEYLAWHPSKYIADPSVIDYVAMGIF